MRRRVVALASVGALVGLVAATALATNSAQPDGEAKRKGKPFNGAGVINTSGDGQTASATSKRSVFPASPQARRT